MADTRHSLCFPPGQEAARAPPVTRRRNMLWTVLAVILILWLLGLIGNIGGGLIHLLLVVALVVFLIQVLSGRRVV
jgi:hypothetical protein